MNWYKKAQEKVFVGSDAELLAKFPERLTTEKLKMAIEDARKMLSDVADSGTRISQSTKMVEDATNEYISRLQKIIDSRK